MAETVSFGGADPQAKPGTSGYATQVGGAATTVGNIAGASEGIGAGHLMEVDIDEQLFQFNSEETPLMSLMLKAKTVPVNSPEVVHYMIDEQRSTLKVKTAVSASGNQQFKLELNDTDKNIIRPFTTILLKGVNAYTASGKEADRLSGVDMMLFCSGIDESSGDPICRAVDGPKTNPSDGVCTTPAIPAGTKVVVLSNALAETQKEVDPDAMIPRANAVYLQKRGMNTIVSDYFESQAKRIPFTQALIAENAINEFKKKGNRTLWAGRPGKMKINIPKMGSQTIYYTEGVRWQIKKEIQARGKWTIEKFIAMAKMFFTGEDVPKTALLLAGKNLLEQIQCIDFSKHPEIQIQQSTNALGWSVTRIHTVFGDIEIKREPTLDKLGWSNSGALLGEDRLVHYRRTAEHEFEEQVEGQEATRKGVIVWDALALKGGCHLWIDGEVNNSNPDAVNIILWEGAAAPTGEALVNGGVYYMLQDCSGTGLTASAGTVWQATVSGTGASATATWKEYTGEIKA